MQVYLSEHIAPSAYARLARHFEIVDNFDHPEQLAAMIIRRAVVPRAVIARAPNLKVIAMHGVSRDTIDTAAAAEYGVPVPNVPGLGAPAVAELAVADLLAHSRALLFPGEEDFGIVPLEAAASGVPVLAYGRGGATETVRDGITGLFFAEQHVEAMEAAILEFERREQGFDPQVLRRHAENFGEERFRREFARQVELARTAQRRIAENQ